MIVTDRRYAADAGLLNFVAPILLAPLFGVPSGMYKLHHKVMHHVVRALLPLTQIICLFSCALLQYTLLKVSVVCYQEGNNQPLDLSSTEPYQRDSLLQFLRCVEL